MFAQLWLNGCRVDVAKTEFGEVWAQDAEGEIVTELIKAVPSAKGCWLRMPPGVVVRGVLVEESHTCRDVLVVDSIEGIWQPTGLQAVDGFLQAWGLLGLPFVHVVEQVALAYPKEVLNDLLALVNKTNPQWAALSDIVGWSDNVHGFALRGKVGEAPWDANASWRENITTIFNQRTGNHVKYVQ